MKEIDNRGWSNIESKIQVWCYRNNMFLCSSVAHKLIVSDGKAVIRTMMAQP
jgi:uncharacterized protein (DUF2132 family)